MAMVGRSGRVHRRARPCQGTYDVGVRVGTAPTARSRSSNSSDVAYVARWSASGSSLRASRVTGHRRANPCTHLVDLERDLRPTPASPAIPGDLIRVHASVSGGQRCRRRPPAAAPGSRSPTSPRSRQLPGSYIQPISFLDMRGTVWLAWHHEPLGAWRPLGDWRWGRPNGEHRR